MISSILTYYQSLQSHTSTFITAMIYTFNFDNFISLFYVSTLKLYYDCTYRRLMDIIYIHNILDIKQSILIEHNHIYSAFEYSKSLIPSIHTLTID